MFNNLKKQEAQSSLRDKKLTVLKDRCPQNHPCPSVRVCPTGALTQSGFQAPDINMDQCIRCGKCVRFCPMRALKLI